MEQVLGVAGVLTLGNLILFSLTVSALAFVFKAAKDTGNANSVQQLFKDFRANLKFTKFEYFCLAVLLGFGLVKLWINLVNPPFGWDNLNYHFTFPVEWIKHANLDTPIVVSDDPAPSYYPINASLIFMWFIFPLKNVFFADLGSLPFVLLSGILVYKIARNLSLERKFSFYAALAFMLIPNVFKQLEIAYIDIIVCAFYLAGLYFILKFKETFNFQYIVLSGISMGLLVGTKSLALVYALTLLVPLILLCLIKLKLKGLAYLGVVFVFVGIFGGFSYLRNLILLGNPLYPIDIVIFGKNLFKGVIDKASYSVHFIPEDYKLTKILYHEGLGAQATIFILPGIFLFPFILLKKKTKDFFSVYISILPLILFVIWRYVVPLANVRYLSPALALGVIYGFCVLSRFIPAKIISFLVFASVLASMSEFSSHLELIISLVVLVLLFFLLIRGFLRLKYVTILGIIFIVIGLPLLNSNYNRNEYKRYANTPFWRDAYLSWEWVNDNTRGANISYVGRPVPFPLYGAGFKNNVYYTSVNSTDPAKLHYYKGSRYEWEYDYLSCHKNYEEDENYRGRADYNIWLDNLRDRKTDFLYIYSLHQIKGVEFPFEDRWAKTHTEVFTPVFTNEIVHIYKVK
jgi:hypothetical protein